MNKHGAIIFFFFYFSTLSFGQIVVFQGKVIDGMSQKGLSNVDLFFKDSLIGNTNDDGLFRIEGIKPGRKSIFIYKEGFSSYKDEGILLVNGIKETFSFELFPLAFDGDTVYVTQAPLANALRHTQLIGVEETDRFPATFFDPARLAQTFAGVVAINDQANHIAIRGQSPNLLTWRIEDLEIVNPNHTSNAGTFSDEPSLSGGGVNMISAQQLKSTIFSAGYAPANISKGASGTMNMHLKSGNLESWQSAFQIGLLGIDVSSEGPIVKDKLSVAANYRYSTIGLLSDLGVDLGEETIKYQDAALTLSLKIPNGSVKAFGIFGNSSNLFSGGDTIATYKDLFNIDYRNKVGVVGINFSKIKRDIVWKGGVAYSKVEGSRSQTWIDENLNPLFPKSTDLEHEKLSIDFNGSKAILTGKIKFGLQFLQEGLNCCEGQNLEENLFFPYVQIDKSISRNLDISFGGRLVFSDQYNLDFEPNISLDLTLNARNRFSILASKVNQLEHPASNYPNSRNQKKPGNLNTALKYFYSINDQSHFTTTLFYQRGWNNYPVNMDHFAHASNWFAESSIEQYSQESFGENYQQGLELGYKKYFASSFFGLANVTLLDSKYRIVNEAEWKESRWDQDWIFNLSFGKEFSKTKKDKYRIFGIHLRLNGFAGQKEPNINIESSRQNWTTIYNYQEGYSNTLKSSFRTDLRFYWRRSKNNRSGLLAIDIQNILNQKNEAYHYFDPYLNQIATQTQLGIIPVISYKYFWNYR